ncbi:MAG: hypothetical protein MJ079_02065 [Ruminococcus sp.]|nr:hypothetical protein [Ruminococcus sp.]
MKKEIITIAAIAVISSMAFASCGSEVEQDSVSVALPKVTVASGEQTTTASGTTTTGTNTTATAVTAASTSSTESDEDTDTTETTTVEDDNDDVPVIEPDDKPTEAPAVQKQLRTAFGTSDLNQNISDIKNCLSGTPFESTDGGACLPRGDETAAYLFDYSGISFTCYSNGGVRYIYSYTITNSNYSTDKGITVGDSLDSIKSAYGEPNMEGNKACYYYDGQAINFLLNSDNTVNSILVTLE